MIRLSDRHADAFDNPAKASCRAGNLPGRDDSRVPVSYNPALVMQEGHAMSIVVAGFVKNAVVVPNAPLPEGPFVEVHVIRGPIEVPPQLQAELDAWQLAGAGTLEMVEQLAQQSEA